MAIAPIDLQTLFTQLDKVGKIHASQKEGQPLQQAIQAIQIQKKTDEQMLQINEAQDTGEGAEKVKDRGYENQSQNRNKNKREQNKNDTDEKENTFVLSDPSLGKNIDITL